MADHSTYRSHHDYFGRVASFMARIAALSGSSVTIGDTSNPDFANRHLRVAMIAEECMEFLDACGYEIHCDAVTGRPYLVFNRHQEEDFIKAIDGLCDILAVTFGTFVGFGLNPWPYFSHVMDTNDAKLAGGATQFREDGKLLKPEGWQPPNLQAILEREVEAARRRDR
jgi:predicted HAD superfamily Cof-like phosphohydrolase